MREKTGQYSEDDESLANWMKAMGHPARVAIMKALLQKKECVCGDLALDLPLSQSTVSQHIKTLREAGLIQGEVEGLYSKYCVNRENFQKFLELSEQTLKTSKGKCK